MPPSFMRRISRSSPAFVTVGPNHHQRIMIRASSGGDEELALEVREPGRRPLRRGEGQHAGQDEHAGQVQARAACGVHDREVV